MAAGGFKGGYEDETLIQLAKVARDHKVNQVLVESNFGGGMFSKVFQPVLNRYHPCSIEEVNQTVQKEKRIIDALEPVMNRHKLIVDYDLVAADLDLNDKDKLYSLFFQLTHITKDRGALRLTTGSMCWQWPSMYWVESVARNEEEAIEDWKARQLAEELEKFMEHVIGASSVSGDNWMTGMRKGTVFDQQTRRKP